MRTAHDIMTPKLKMILSSDSLEDTIKTYLEQGITTSPVMTPQQEPLGMLSELKLTKAYMIHRSKNQGAGKIANHPDLLDPICTVDEDAPLSEVLKEMINTPTHRVLVKNKKGTLVGIISPKDMMRAMIGQANPAQNIKEKLKETEEQLKVTLRKVKEIEKHLEIYEKTFHETPYMMHAVNEKGDILMANKREHDMLGYKMGELSTKTIYDIYAKSVHHEATQGLKKVIETGVHQMTYTTLMKKNGTPLRCDIASSAIFGDDGKFISTISVLRPIDSDELLRILNGIVDEKGGLLSKFLMKA